MIVVMLPGMDGSGALFADFVSALQGRSIVVSYPTDQPHGYSALEELVQARLPKDEPFILLAESFSGPIALSLGAKRLPQLRAVVLVCSFAKLPIARLTASLGRLAALVPFWRAPVSVAAAVLLGRSRSSLIEADLARAIGVVSSDVWRARLRAALTVDTISALSNIRVPLLYLRASRDRVVSSSAAAVISAHVQGAKVVDIDGPHFLLQTKPGESAAAVRAFTREHGLDL